MVSTPVKKCRHVLLVEDDQDLRESLATLLEQEGYEVTAASNGLEALERLRWGLRPFVILLDMRMYVMNGWEFKRELQRDPGYASTQIIIMTGGQLKPDDLAGCEGWIAKPIKRSELLEKIERCSF